MSEIRPFVTTRNYKRTKRLNPNNKENRRPKRSKCDVIPFDGCDDDFELTDWEFDTQVPSWLQKAMKKHKSLTLQTDMPERIKLKFAKEPIWWRIIDASDPKIAQDFLSEAEFLDLNSKISSALNIGDPVNDWTVLRPTAERCLQLLSKLDTNQLRKVGELVKPKGVYGAIIELMKMELNEGSKESTPEYNLFDNDDKTPVIGPIEEDDYLDQDVGYILELIRYMCEMLKKGIPQRKNSERDIDMFIKRHIFSCLEDILDCHFGDMISRASRDRRSSAIDAPDNAEGFHVDWMFTKHELGKDSTWGREFSVCESKPDDDTKDLLKTQKTLRDMHKGLVKAISMESGGSLSKQVLRACTKLNMLGFVSKSFFVRAILIIYVGAEFYLSFELAKFNIPITYNELDEVITIARIMLQIKKLLHSTIRRFKLIKEKAEKERFASGKVVMRGNGSKECRTPKKPTKSRKKAL